MQDIIKSHIDVNHVTTPLTGVRRALRAIRARQIGYLAPYVSEISSQMCSLLADEDGLQIAVAATFGEGRDSIVGCIHPQSILDAIDAIVDQASRQLDAIFISCTSLKCAAIIDTAEAKHGIPIISSNSAIAWNGTTCWIWMFRKQEKVAYFIKIDRSTFDKSDWPQSPSVKSNSALYNIKSLTNSRLAFCP